MANNNTSIGAILWRAWLLLSGLWAIFVILLYWDGFPEGGLLEVISWEWSELLGFAIAPFVGFLVAPFLRWVFTGSFFQQSK